MGYVLQHEDRFHAGLHDSQFEQSEQSEPGRVGPEVGGSTSRLASFSFRPAYYFTRGR